MIWCQSDNIVKIIPVHFVSPIGSPDFVSRIHMTADHEPGPSPLQEICTVRFVISKLQYSILQTVVVERPP